MSEIANPPDVPLSWAIKKASQTKSSTKYHRKSRTRPSVNYAKHWLDQLFLISGLVWSGKCIYHLWMWSLRDSQQPFFCVFGQFRHGDTQPTNQPGDPCASLPLICEKSVFCNSNRLKSSCCGLFKCSLWITMKLTTSWWPRDILSSFSSNIQTF